MGAYLAHPQTDKFSSDENNEKLICGASAMQGWRISQEDAHNCILDFAENASLFAVYDGHGGKEVAQYTADKLPDIIRNMETYKTGKFGDCLKEAFLKFDKSLTEDSVIAVLKEIAKEKGDGEGDDDDEDELENIGDLKQEAEMPLDEVIAKYATAKGLDSHIQKWKRSINHPPTPVSPFLRAKSEDDDLGISSSVASTEPSSAGKSTTEPQPSTVESSSCEPSVSSSSREVSRTSLAEKYANGEVQAPDSSCEGSETAQAKVVNGNGLGEQEEDGKQEAEISSSGETDIKGKGKALVKNSPSPIKKKAKVVNHEELFKKFVSASGDDTSDSDSEDGNFVVKEVEAPSSEDEAAPDCQSSENAGCTSTVHVNEDVAEDEEEEEDEDDDEEEDEDDEEDDDDVDDSEFTMAMTNELKAALEQQEEFAPEIDDDDHSDEGFGKRFLINALKEKRPGSDSGCTAVVALVIDNKVYVANAGDSRCIASKSGEAVELSLDHKPEDRIELARIVAAGGRVSSDGRVNGGLNLSRALGDHVYKKVIGLSDAEQMISPLPDIKELEITPDVEFLVLACDGIWNYMSSQEVIDFVRARLLLHPDKLSLICEQLFDACLAPTTMGDGTGCDNMTAIIVQFRGANLSAEIVGKRRAASPVTTENKRAKTESETAAEAISTSAGSSSSPKTKTDFPEVAP